MIRGRERKKEQSIKTRRVSSKVAHSNPSPIALCIALGLVRVIKDVIFLDWNRCFGRRLVVSDAAGLQDRLHREAGGRQASQVHHTLNTQTQHSRKHTYAHTHTHTLMYTQTLACMHTHTHTHVNTLTQSYIYIQITNTRILLALCIPLQSWLANVLSSLTD